ncbi:MAG: VOC family protein [Gammaproteobacteria bacterium]|nr:VOC family protein [Gammaproteobacteria bacterium]
MLNHAAWVTPDAELTADFYTRILGMEIASTVFDIHAPVGGEQIPFFHIFFRMKDGSTLAFFEAPGLPPRPHPSHPAYHIFDHIALQAESREEVIEWKSWLESNGVAVFGPTDHKGLIFSIYFDDPVGIRLEITTPLDPDWNRHTEIGKADLAMWSATKRKAQLEGCDARAALTELVRELRKR